MNEENPINWPGPPLDRDGDKSCPHLNHAVHANVFRLVDEHDPEKVTGWTTEIRIRCAHCGIEFEWVGVQAGMMPTRPMCDLTARELRAPIKPKGSLVMPGILGYAVRYQ